MNDVAEGAHGPRMVVTRALPASPMAHIAAATESWINPDDPVPTASELQVVTDEWQPGALIVIPQARIDAARNSSLPPAVRVIGTLSVGHELIDLGAARGRGIAVVRTPGSHGDAVAEMAILLLLCAARRAREGERMICERTWRGWSPTQLLGCDITGARLGVLGMGRIGRAVAQRAKAGFGMEIQYHNRTRLAPELEDGAIYHPTAGGLLAGSDFLVICAPSAPKTAAFLNAERLAQLPRGAVVVNVARGNLVDDAALIDALRSGQVGAAGLGLLNGEPDIHPGYRDLPNVFLLPHRGSSSTGTRVRMGEMPLDSIDAVLAGGKVVNRLV